MTAPDINSPEEQARYERGLAVLAAVDGGSAPGVMDSLGDVAPALAHHIVAFGFGDIYARPGLNAVAVAKKVFAELDLLPVKEA